MSDIIMMVLVLGAMVLAFTVDIAAAIGWLRRRWR